MTITAKNSFKKLSDKGQLIITTFDQIALEMIRNGPGTYLTVAPLKISRSAGLVCVRVDVSVEVAVIARVWLFWVLSESK